MLKVISNFKIPTFVSVIIAIVFLLFIVVIGAPRTKANYLYNLAKMNLNKGQVTAAMELLEQAYKTWPESYIKLEIDALSQSAKNK